MIALPPLALGLFVDDVVDGGSGHSLTKFMSGSSAEGAAMVPASERRARHIGGPMIRPKAMVVRSRLPANPDGGRLADGEPIGASGLRRFNGNLVPRRGLARAQQPSKPVRTACSHVCGALSVSGIAMLQR